MKWPFTIEQSTEGLVLMLARWLNESVSEDTGTRFSLAGHRFGDTKPQDQEISYTPWQPRSLPKLTRAEKKIVGEQGEYFARVLRGATSTAKLGQSFANTKDLIGEKADHLFAQFKNGRKAEAAFSRSLENPWEFFFQLVKLGLEFGEGICRDSLCAIKDHQREVNLVPVGYGRDFLYVWAYALGADKPFHYLEGLSRPALLVDNENWRNVSAQAQQYFEYCTGLGIDTEVTHWDTGLNGSVPKQMLRHLTGDESAPHFDGKYVRMLKAYHDDLQAKVVSSRWRGIGDLVQGFEHMPKPYLRVMDWTVNEEGAPVPRLCYGGDCPMAVALVFGVILAGMKRRGEVFTWKPEKIKVVRQVSYTNEFVAYKNKKKNSYYNEEGPALIWVKGDRRGTFTFMKNDTCFAPQDFGVAKAEFYMDRLYSFSVSDKDQAVLRAEKESLIWFDPELAETIFSISPSGVVKARFGEGNVTLTCSPERTSVYLSRFITESGGTTNAEYVWEKGPAKSFGRCHKGHGYFSMGSYCIWGSSPEGIAEVSSSIGKSWMVNEKDISRAWETIFQALEAFQDIAITASKRNIDCCRHFSDFMKELSGSYVKSEIEKGGIE